MANIVQDLEAEQLFLAIIASEPALIVPYSIRVDMDDFADYKHKLLWQGFNHALMAKQKPTVEWMRFWLESQRDGGSQTYYDVVSEAYLRKVYAPEMLLGHDPPIFDTGKIDMFSARLLDAADRQLRYVISEDLRESADQKGVNADTLWSDLFGRVLERRKSRATVKPLGEYWKRIQDQVNDWWHGRPGHLISTGYPSLDAALGGGLAPKRLIVLGGDSGGGKTTAILNIMIEMAKRGHGCGMSSVEMAGEDLFTILACRETSISYRDLRQGMLAVEGDRFKTFELERHKALKTRFYQEVDALHKLPIKVDDSSENVTSAQVYTSVLLAAAFSEISLWGIDYAELLTDGVGQDSEAVRIPAIFKAAKNLARLLAITVILLSQITKDVKHRPDAKPKKQDLRYGPAAPADYVWLTWYPGGLIATGDISKALIKKRYGDLGVTGEPDQLIFIQVKARYGQNQFIVLGYEPALYRLTDPNQHLATAWFDTGQVKVQEGF